MKIKKKMRPLKRSEHGSGNCGGACFAGDNVFKEGVWKRHAMRSEIDLQTGNLEQK